MNAAAPPVNGSPRPFAAFEWLIAWRYLRARRREGGISVIAWYALIGVMLGVATLIVVQAVMIGFPFLTLTIVLGALWAEVAWGRYWGWDPKETASLVTWLIYGGYLHARVVRGWRGERSAALLLVGFAAVLFTYFGNLFFGGLHSYAGLGQ